MISKLINAGKNRKELLVMDIQGLVEALRPLDIVTAIKLKDRFIEMSESHILDIQESNVLDTLTEE